MRYSLLTAVFLSISIFATSQNDRITDDNNINWAQAFFTIPLTNNWSMVAEYQWRRTDGLKNWQQSLLRSAFQYKLTEQVSVAAGYGWIETFPYGDYPLAANGTFPEHRIYEQLQIKQNISKFSLTQRLRLEQRWLGRRAAVPQREIEEWLFSHRFRYLLRVQHPITSNGKFYAAAADEVFIGAGKNVGVNIFDQNRLMFIVGGKVNNNISVELGYINQILTQGRRINNQTIIQNNNGLILAGIFNF